LTEDELMSSPNNGGVLGLKISKFIPSSLAPFSLGIGDLGTDT